MDTKLKYIQADNPTDEERHRMLKSVLEESNHSEDFDNIVELSIQGYYNNLFTKKT